MEKIQIKTPSRLHFGLIDMNGELGRVDGGIGAVLKEPNIIVNAEFNEKLKINCTERLDEIQTAVNKIQNKFNINEEFNTNIKIDIENHVPAHSGLGSTTQLLLGAAKAVTELNGISLSARDLSNIIGRGGTSGIGTAAFDYGGFVLDGGHGFGAGKEKDTFLPSSKSTRASPAPVLARYDIPKNWYFVLAIPEVMSKIYGQHEVNIFQKFCPIPREEVEKLSRLILMKILPAVVEKDIDSFGDGLTGMQDIGFKKIEVSLQNKIVVEVLRLLKRISYGSGLSSFGPTVYALADGSKHACEVAEQAKEKLNNLADGKVNFEIFITSANNGGAEIEHN